MSIQLRALSRSFGLMEVEMAQRMLLAVLLMRSSKTGNQRVSMPFSLLMLLAMEINIIHLAVMITLKVTLRDAKWKTKSKSLPRKASISAPSLSMTPTRR